MKNTTRKFVSAGLSLFLALGIATASFANGEPTTKTEKSIELKFIGKISNQPVYMLNVSNPVQEEYVIIFKDSYGIVLYSDVVRKSSFTQKFQINRDEVGDEIIRVEVKSRSTKTSEIFTIERNQTVVEENVVARIQ